MNKPWAWPLGGLAKLNQHWRYSLVNIRNLVEEAKCDTTQTVSHMLPGNAAVYAVGLDDKAGILVGEKIELLLCDKVVASVIHQLNIAKDVEESQYSGGPEGNGTIAVALHDSSTLDPSDVFTHNNTCVLNDMEALAIAEMNIYTFENMSDTDDQEEQIKH
eukprot:scaffold6745_cov38-Attheya_sp.AAC.4